MMQRLTIVAVFAVILSSVNGASRRDAQAQDTSCDKLVQCVTPVVTFSSDEALSANAKAENLTAFLASPEYAALCRTVEAAQACQEEAEAECDIEDVKTQVDTVLNVGEFTCSDEGKAEIVGLTESPCVDDDELLSEAMSGVDNCLVDFKIQIQLEILDSAIEGKQLEKEDACPFIGDLSTCCVRAFQDVCGDAAGKFAKFTFDAALLQAEQEAGVECEEQAERSVENIRAALYWPQYPR